jgi:hypothetical protein
MDEAMQLSKETGNLGLWTEVSEFRMYSMFFQSRYADAASGIEQTNEVASRDGHTQVLGRMHVAKARLLYYQGKTDEARREYFDHEAEINTALSMGSLTVSRTCALGFLIDLHTRCEEWDAALKVAATLDSLLTNAPTISYMVGAEAASSIALYLTLWERQKAEGYRQSAKTMLSLYHRKYTRRNAIGRPIEQMYRCWYHWLDGSEKAARKAGALAVQAAQGFRMPYFEASARCHLARFMPAADPASANHLETATELFYQVEATYDAERIRRRMQPDAP